MAEPGPESMGGEEWLKAQERSRELRGSYLDLFNMLDSMIARVLVDHFCPSDPDRQALLMSCSFGSPVMSSNARIDALRDLLETAYPDIAEKHPMLIRKLHDLRKWRNRIAHAQIDAARHLASDQTDGLAIMRYAKGKVVREVLTHDDVTSWIALLGMVFGELVQVNMAVNNATAPNRSKP